MATSPPGPPPILHAHLRIARPTRSIPALLPFYIRGLGFHRIGSFTAHAGYNGIMLGHAALPYHLEFTEEIGHDPGRAPTQDNLLVFYLPDEAEWAAAVRRMESEGFEAVRSANPYWDLQGRGRTYEDAEGWRVVLYNAAWEAF